MRWATLIVISLMAAAIAAPASGQSEAELQKLFASFLKTNDIKIDAVPDLFPGGFARISVYAKKASLGGMLVDEVWFRVIGAELNVSAMQRGELRVDSWRESAIYVRFTLKSLQEYFISGNAFKDIRLWTDGQFLFGEGTIPLNNLPVRVWLKGWFALGGTKDIYFYIDNMRVNGVPLLDPIIRTLEAKYNPVLTQSTWPVTFAIRSLRVAKDVVVVSSQADASSPCAFCTGSDAPNVAP
jgi:hypothetical protein